MIQVQIASELTRQGVGGVRWVLVDASDAATPPAPAPAQRLAEAAQSAAAAPGQNPRALVSLTLLKLAVLGLGLAAAGWLAHGVLGTPRGEGSALRAPTPQATPSMQPLAPAMPASAAPQLTADLRP